MDAAVIYAQADAVHTDCDDDLQHFIQAEQKLIKAAISIARVIRDNPEALASLGPTEHETVHAAVQYQKMFGKVPLSDDDLTREAMIQIAQLHKKICVLGVRLCRNRRDDAARYISNSSPAVESRRSPRSTKPPAKTRNPHGDTP